MEDLNKNIEDYNLKVNKDILRHLNFETLKHFGVPKYLSPLIEIHAYLGIIAVGTFDGIIKM